MNLETRMAIERRLIRKLIRTAKKHGYALVKVWDGEAHVRTTTETKAMDAVFSVDESVIYFRHPEESIGRCCVIVLGNDGWDAIADSSEHGKWDKVNEEMDAYSDKLCEAHA